MAKSLLQALHEFAQGEHSIQSLISLVLQGFSSYLLL